MPLLIFQFFLTGHTPPELIKESLNVQVVFLFLFIARSGLPSTGSFPWPYRCSNRKINRCLPDLWGDVKENTLYRNSNQ